MRRKIKQLKDFPPKQVQAAREYVAENWRKMGYQSFLGNDYPPHITLQQKACFLKRDLVYADKIQKGEVDGCFTVWQRIYLVLTGECVAFLP